MSLKVTFSKNKISQTVTCADVEVSVTAKAIITDSTFEITENKKASKTVGDLTCTASLDTSIANYEVSGNTLYLFDDSGVEITLQRVR